MQFSNHELYNRDPVEKLLEGFKGKFLAEIPGIKLMEAKNQSPEEIYARIYKEVDDFPVLLPDKAKIKPYKEEPRDYPKLPEGHRVYIQTIPGQNATTAYFFYTQPTKDLGDKPVGATVGTGALSVRVELTAAEVSNPDEAHQKIQDFFQRNLENIIQHHAALEEDWRNGTQVMKDEFIKKIEEKRQLLFSAGKLDSFFT